jgi:hypothetical protein
MDILKEDPVVLVQRNVPEYFLRHDFRCFLNKTTCHVCLSVRPHGTTRLPLNGFFMKSDIYIFFQKYVGVIKVSLKSDKNNGYFT